MAAEQDSKELSMAEILASIKKILADTEVNADNKKTSEEPLMPKISLSASDETNFADAETTNSYAAPFLPISPKDTPPVAEKEADEEDMKIPYLALHEDEQSVSGQKLRESSHPQNISDEIIDSFTRMFEQNDFCRQTNRQQIDTDALLRQIITQTVAEKLDNAFLQKTIRETIVPVLEEWLSHYLPKLVAKEVERVMVKTGRS